MIARVLRVAVDPGQIDAVVGVYREIVRPIHARAAGLRHHYVLANRETGLIEIVGVWDSVDAVTSIAPELEPARARLWAHFGRDPELEIYEVADELTRA